MLRAFTFCRSTAAAADNIGPGGHMSKYATGPHGREWWWSSCRRRPLHWTGSEWVTDLPHDAYSESRICTFMWVSRPTDQAVRWWRHGACLLFKSASDIDDDETVFYANRIQLGKDVKCPIAPPESLTDPFSLTTNSSGINKFSRDNCCCPVQSRFLFLKVSAFFFVQLLKIFRNVTLLRSIQSNEVQAVDGRERDRHYHFPFACPSSQWWILFSSNWWHLKLLLDRDEINRMSVCFLS